MGTEIPIITTLSKQNNKPFNKEILKIQQYIPHPKDAVPKILAIKEMIIPFPNLFLLFFIIIESFYTFLERKSIFYTK